jgi:hypothetical protein
MKKLLLFLSFLSIGLFVQGQTLTDVKSVIPDKVDPYVLQPQYDMSKLKDIIPHNAAASSSLQRNRVDAPLNRTDVLRKAGDTPVDTVSYFCVAQSYFKGYTFDYSGGDVSTYEVGVAIDGTNVTFKNMFNLYDR